MPPHRLVPLSSLFLLAACAGSPDTPRAVPQEASAPAPCNADAARAHLGKPADEAALEAVRAASGARSLRVLKPGQAMTMDYREDRVNVMEDAEGRIEKISCG